MLLVLIFMLELFFEISSPIVIMLSVIMLSAIMLSVIMLSAIMLSVIMLSVIMLSVTFSCCYSECRYAKCCYAEYHGATMCVPLNFARQGKKLFSILLILHFQILDFKII